MTAMTLLLLAACSERPGDVRFAEPGETDTHETDAAPSGATDTDTAPPSDTDAPVDTDPPTDADTDATVCFPGPDLDWSTCYTTYRYDYTELGSDYDYPEPYGGSANYREPIRWLDLDALDGEDKIAPNFTLDELAQSWKGRWAVVQPHAVERIQDLRDELGALVVNSGYRPPAYNADVGGATYSRHIYGDAVDLDPASVSLDVLGEACADNDAGYVGYYEAHIHCDWRDDPLDEAFFGPAGRRATPEPVPARRMRLQDVSGRWTAPAEGWDEGEPLREWSALDADGTVLATGRGRSFEPPPGARTLRVVVGRELEESVQLTE